LDLDARNVIVDEISIVDVIDFTKVIPKGLYDQCFNLVSWNAFYNAGLFGLPLNQYGRDVVPVFDAPFASVGWSHPVATIVKDATEKERLRFAARGFVIVELLIKLGLDRSEQLLIDNCGLLAGKKLALEGHLAYEEAIAQQVSERSASEGYPAYSLSRS
jgi:hypothetical protein